MKTLIKLILAAALVFSCAAQAEPAGIAYDSGLWMYEVPGNSYGGSYFFQYDDDTSKSGTAWLDKEFKLHLVSKDGKQRLFFDRPMMTYSDIQTCKGGQIDYVEVKYVSSYLHGTMSLGYTFYKCDGFRDIYIDVLEMDISK